VNYGHIYLKRIADVRGSKCFVILLNDEECGLADDDFDGIPIERFIMLDMLKLEVGEQVRVGTITDHPESNALPHSLADPRIIDYPSDRSGLAASLRQITSKPGFEQSVRSALNFLRENEDR